MTILGKKQMSEEDIKLNYITPVILNGRSVIIGFQKTQIYQRFAGSRQEGFILKIQNDENNAAQRDNGRRFPQIAGVFSTFRPVPS